MQGLSEITKKQHPLLVNKYHSVHLQVFLSVDLHAADVYIKNRHKIISQSNHNYNHKPSETTQYSSVSLLEATVKR